MLRGQKRWILLLAAISGFLMPVPSWAENGPVVQVFTQEAGGGDDQPVIPLWRVPVHITVSVNGGYNGNVNTSGVNSEGSIFTSANIGVDYSFGTSRTKAVLRTGTGVTYYPDLSDNRYDPNLFLDLTVTHQANRRLTLNGSINASYQAEPDFADDLGLNRRAGNYFSTQNSISASYQWLPRISTVTNYGLGIIKYDGDAVAALQDHFDHQFGESFRFLFLPVTTLVADYRLSFSSFDTADRDSISHSLLAGVDHTFLPGLQGTLRAGVDFRSSDQQFGPSSDTVSPHFEGNLTYAVGGKTSLTWNASYSSEDSNVATSPGSLALRSGLQLSHSFTPRITASVSGFYAHTENEASNFFFGGNPAFAEDSLDFSLSMSYAVNRFLSANLGYNRSEVDSELALRSYSQNRYSFGLSLSF